MAYAMKTHDTEVPAKARRRFAGCLRAATIVEVVWARARDTALAFYLDHGFTVEGDGFIDEQTQKPHHLIVRRLT